MQLPERELQTEGAEETKGILFGLLGPRSGRDILEVRFSQFPIFCRIDRRKGRPGGGKWVCLAEGQEAAGGAVLGRFRGSMGVG